MTPEGDSYDSIREKLREFMDAAGDRPASQTRDGKQPFSSGFRSFNDNLQDKIGVKDASNGPSILGSDNLTKSIFRLMKKLLCRKEEERYANTFTRTSIGKVLPSRSHVLSREAEVGAKTGQI